MKINVTFSMFCDAFRDMRRKDQFTYAGLEALYDYLIEYEEDIGEEIELDVIALCCEYTEYSDEELIEEYEDRIDRDALNDPDDEDEMVSAIVESLQEETDVIEYDGGCIVRDF